MPESANPMNPVGGVDLVFDVEGALLLLSYAAQSNIPIEIETAKVITHSKDLCSNNRLVGDDLALFYQAFGKLSALTSPVTIMGLRSTIAQAPNQTSLLRISSLPDSTKSIKWYWWLAIAVLIFLLVSLQFYWVIGSRASNNIQQWMEEKNKARYALLKLEGDKEDKLSEFDPEKIQYQEAIVNRRNRIQTYLLILNIYDIPSLWKKTVNSKKESDPSSIKDNGSNKTKTPESEKDITLLLANANFTLYALQGYILPLLYGLLGACVYVLRTLSRDIRAFSYTPDAFIYYKIRLILGTLSGLAVTWFSDANTETLKALSPLALSFLAGYSVEILFAAMDRFISAFSGGNVKAT